MNNGLLFLGGLLVVVLAALFAVPNFVDWNGYRGVFEEEASKVLGRDVRVGGSVNLKLLPVPYVRFEKVRIANLTGQTGEPFVRAESFTMWLSGPALLRGVLEASEIELNKPVLTLAVDASGGGNWTNIELKPGDLPFVPRDVALRSVKLIDGTVSIYNATTERLALLEGIYGELSADGLRGPFRFKGSASWSGTAHDVKFATDPPTADGSFSLKVSARADRSPNVYLLDGRVAGLSSKPTFTGSWTAKLAVPGSETIAADSKSEPPLLDLTSKVVAGALGARFDDITLSLDNAAEPQTITGSAVAGWAAAPHLDVKLASKWLDIDWLAGAGQGSAHVARLTRLAVGLMQSVAGNRAASAQINLEQVKVGGETAGGLIIDADRRGNTTHFKTFKASLPGGSRLDLAGDLKDDAGKLSFSGNVFIGGTSLARLRTWSEKSGMPLDIKSDGPFSASGKLDIDETRFALLDASGDLSGETLTGDLTITHDAREKTEVTLQAVDLDTRQIFPKTTAALGAAFHKALGLAPTDDDGKPAAALPGDMRLRVIAGRLTDGQDTYRDVDVTFELEGNEIRLPAAKVTTANGLAIGLEGRVKTGSGTPVGMLAYDLVGTTPDAMRDLIRKTGLAGILGEDRLKGLNGGKLAGLIRLGLRAPAAADVTFDGTMNGSHLSGAGEFDGGLGDWRTRPSRLQMTLASPSLAVLLTELGQDVGQGLNAAIATTAGAQQPAQASVVATGSIGTGVETRLDITSQGLAMTYAGKAKWPADAPLALDGTLDVKAADFADALAVVGISLPAGAGGIATQGSVAVTRDQSIWTLSTRDLALGTSKVGADLKVTTAGTQRIEGKIGADRATVTGLLSALIDKPAAPIAPDQPLNGAPNRPPNNAAGGDSVAALDERSVWPEGVFDFNTLAGTEADIRLSFQSLDLSGNLATRDGEMRLALAPGKLTVSDFAADAAGGRMTGGLSLEKTRDGVALTTKLKLDRAKLASFSPAAKGLATFDLEAAARSQSPAGLVAVMSGTGRATLAGVEIPGPAINTASDVVDAVMRGKQQDDPRTVSAAVTTALATGKLGIGDRELSMQLADGAIKFETVKIKTADGTVEATATADLTSLNVSAASQLTALVKPLPPPAIPLPGWEAPPSKGPLPPVVVLYSGKLDDLATMEPSVDVADFQRELAVRRMERNVEELEQSRRLDEERSRLEKERRKALEEQRAADIAAARAKREVERLPPVIPESAGTADANAAQPAATPPAPVGTPDAQANPGANPAANPQTNPQSNVQSSPAAAAPADAAKLGTNASAPTDAVSNGGNTVLTPKIMIEPISPPPAEMTQGDAPGAAAVDPETGLPVESKTSTRSQAVRPASGAQRSQQQRRTSSDEVLKSLGGFQ